MFLFKIQEQCLVDAISEMIVQFHVPLCNVTYWVIGSKLKSLPSTAKSFMRPLKLTLTCLI